MLLWLNANTNQFVVESPKTRGTKCSRWNLISLAASRFISENFAGRIA
jgi:hypothetical protein